MMVAGATSGGSFLLFLYSMLSKGKFNAAFGGDSMTEDKIDVVSSDSKFADPEEQSDPAAIRGEQEAEEEAAGETPAEIAAG